MASVLFMRIGSVHHHTPNVLDECAKCFRIMQATIAKYSGMVVYAWCVNGVCTVYAWCMYGVCMVCAWCVHMVCAWCVHGVCMVCAGHHR